MDKENEPIIEQVREDLPDEFLIIIKRGTAKEVVRLLLKLGITPNPELFQEGKIDMDDVDRIAESLIQKCNKIRQGHESQFGTVKTAIIGAIVRNNVFDAMEMSQSIRKKEKHGIPRFIKNESGQKFIQTEKDKKKA